MILHVRVTRTELIEGHRQPSEVQPNIYTMVAANVVLVQLLVTAASVSTAPSQLPWGWPGWNNIATSTWGSNSSCCGVVPKNLTCCSGVDSKEGKLYPTAFFTVATTAVAAPHSTFGNVTVSSQLSSYVCILLSFLIF